MTFTCCICGQTGKTPLEHREAGFCLACGSNARLRGVALAVMRGLHLDTSVPLAAQPKQPEIVAIGLSDHPCYTPALERLCAYRNTYLHTEPRLDLCDPASVAAFGDLDLIVCSDVIEHTSNPPPVTLARLHAMLRPGGMVAFSVPTYRTPFTIEWYPGARSLRVVEATGRHVVVWETLRGAVYVDPHPVFHGGPGDVLEMRICSHQGVQDAARAAGLAPDVLGFEPDAGYVWPIQPEYVGLDAPMDGRVMVLRRPR